MDRDSERGHSTKRVMLAAQAGSEGSFMAALKAEQEFRQSRQGGKGDGSRDGGGKVQGIETVWSWGTLATQGGGGEETGEEVGRRWWGGGGEVRNSQSPSTPGRATPGVLAPEDSAAS